jgi:glycine oxidase
VRALVVGAGIIGASIADALARGGADVVVLDMRGAGRGASQASAGILAPYTEADPGSPLLDLGSRSLALYDDFVAGLADRTGHRIEYARGGTLEAAFDDDTAARLRASGSWLDELGVSSAWVEGAALHAAEPALAPAARGALVVPRHGWVGVASLVRALVHSARLAGAVFETPLEAARVTASGRDLIVRADGRTHAADAVVIAAGCWSGRIRLDDRRPWPVRPVRGQLIEIGWPSDAPRPARVVWGPRGYMVPWSSGSVLVGATSEEVGFDERSTMDGIRALAAAAAEVLPASRRAAVVDIRVGLRPATPDGLPIVGPLAGDPRIVAATGHYRNGILLAPLTAAIVASWVLQRTPDRAFAVTAPDRF